MNNTVTNKIKHFPEMFTLGPQIALKQKLQDFLLRSIITIKIDIQVYKYKNDYICKGLLQTICFVTVNI